jgi:hypothetical protein
LLMAFQKFSHFQLSHLQAIHCYLLHICSAFGFTSKYRTTQTFRGRTFSTYELWEKL